MEKHRAKVMVFILVLSMLVLSSGCGVVTKCYPGPQRELNELAILYMKDAEIKDVDGQLMAVYSMNQEYHLLPGSHEIRVRYSAVAGGGYYYSSRLFEITHLFEAGHVYVAQGMRVSKDKVAIEIVRKGTIEEMAPVMAERQNSPCHWKELVEK